MHILGRIGLALFLYIITLLLSVVILALLEIGIALDLSEAVGVSGGKVLGNMATILLIPVLLILIGGGSDT